MSLDTSIINKLKQLGDMMDSFILQRNQCNTTMKIMGIELEKLHVFITKMGLHVNRSMKNSDDHKKSIHKMIDDESDVGGDFDDETVNDVKTLSTTIEGEINTTIADRKKFDQTFAKNLLKLADDPEITKQELKAKLKKMQRLYTAKYRKFNNSTNLAVKALKQNACDQTDMFKENNKEIIQKAIKKEKKKFLHMISEKIDEYEKEQHEDMTNINEVWSELQKSINDLQTETKKPVIAKLEIKSHPVDELKGYIETPANADPLEERLKTILEGGTIKLKKRKSGSKRTLKRRNKNKKEKNGKSRAKTIRI